MKLRRKLFVAVSSLAVASAVLLAGCGVPAQEGTALKETGILTLSVNPEIQIEYNRDGKVTALTGLNHDGKSIVDAYPDYIGKDCETVLRDLIVEINEAGYFVDDIDGNKKDIVLQLEPGSVLPSDDFLEDMSASTREAVKGLSLPSDIVTIDDDDYDPAYSKDGKPSSYITLEKAKEIALTQANIDIADAVFDDKEFDHDDGTPIFELEFTADGNEYEYDIHAVTGKVMRAEHKVAKMLNKRPDGAAVSDYNDTDYGPNNDGVTDYDDTDYGPNNDGVTDYDDTDYGPNNDGVTDYDDTDYGPNNDGVTDYDDTGYGPNNDGVTDYNDTDYGPNNDGVTDYNDTDYGPNNDGVTDYNDTDYGPNNDGVTDYNDTDYGPNNDGVTDYNDTDYGPNNDGVTDYNDTDYGPNHDGGSDYGNSNYGDTNYDDGGSDYDWEADDDGDSDYDD